MRDSLKFHIHIKDGSMASCSDPLLKIAHGSRVASVFGKIDFMADYKGLRLFVPTNAQIAKTVRSYCASEDLVREVHKLTELVGSYVLIVEQDSVAAFIYSSGEIDVPVYYGCRPKEVMIDTSWHSILKWSGQIEISRTDLEYFLRYGSSRYPRTLFQNLWVLKPYALYSFSSEGVTLATHSFPGFHTTDPTKPPQYTIDDYLKAVSCYKDLYDSFAVAYSGGVDSHGLATLYGEKTDQLLTVDYKEPYADLQRKSERMAGAKAAKKLGKKYPEIALDLSDLDRLNEYYRDYVYHNPSSAFFALFCYVLAEYADSQVILSGQSADNIWDWGLHQIFFQKRGSHSTRIIDDISNLFRSSVSLRTRVGRLVGRYLSRFAMIHSFEKMRFERIINVRGRYFGSEFDCLRECPYKIFVLHRYVNYCTSGETTAWTTSARFFSKKGILPYISPLALYVNSHIKRRDYFDMKSPFRRRYSDFDPTSIEIEVEDPSDYQRWYHSPFFDQLQNSALGRSLLGLRAKLGIKEARPEYPIQELHLYHLFEIMRHRSDIVKTDFL